MAVGKKTGGRKKGSRNKASVKRQQEVAASGKTPLEVMLENMRFAHEEAAGLLAKLLEDGAEPPEGFDALKNIMGYRQMAQDAAKDAAPYVHPRLMAMKHSGDEENPVRIERIERVIVSSKNSDG